MLHLTTFSYVGITFTLFKHGSIMNRQHCDPKGERLAGLAGFTRIAAINTDRDNFQKEVFIWVGGFRVLKTHDGRAKAGRQDQLQA